MKRLSERLKTIASLLGNASEYWDVCCDHGLLGMTLLRETDARVAFVDRVPELTNHLIMSAEMNLSSDELARASFHACDARDLEGPIRGAVAIAGVGGETIARIVRAWTERGILRADRLVLGPHKDERWLISSWRDACGLADWEVEACVDVEERGRKRVLLALRRGSAPAD